jgi:hypothetical protein
MVARIVWKRMEEALQLVDLQSEKQIYSKLVQQIIPGGERRRFFSS